jgi:hypothetical protein
VPGDGATLPDLAYLCICQHCKIVRFVILVRIRTNLEGGRGRGRGSSVRGARVRVPGQDWAEGRGGGRGGLLAGEEGGLAARGGGGLAAEAGGGMWPVWSLVVRLVWSGLVRQLTD